MVACPFHGGGKERTPSCAIRRDAPVYFCHGCQSGGHIAYILRAFGISKTSATAAIDGLRLQAGAVYRKKSSREIFGNNPYRSRWVLDDFDTLGPYFGIPSELVRQGFTEKTLEFFEVGWDYRNLRITFPIRNIYGELIGVSGRATVPEQEQKYKIYRHELWSRPELGLPPDYDMGAAKKATMWNFHILHTSLLTDPSPQPLVVVEGFKACMWTWQCGYQRVSALIGSYLSELHAELLARLAQPVILFLDNNAAGHSGTEKAAALLHAYGVPFTVGNYPDEREQPDDLEPEEVTDALATSLSYIEWRTAS